MATTTNIMDIVGGNIEYGYEGGCSEGIITHMSMDNIQGQLFIHGAMILNSENIIPGMLADIKERMLFWKPLPAILSLPGFVKISGEEVPCRFVDIQYEPAEPMVQTNLNGDTFSINGAAGQCKICFTLLASDWTYGAIVEEEIKEVSRFDLMELD